MIPLTGFIAFVCMVKPLPFNDCFFLLNASPGEVYGEYLSVPAIVVKLARALALTKAVGVRISVLPALVNLLFCRL